MTPLGLDTAVSPFGQEGRRGQCVAMSPFVNITIVTSSAHVDCKVLLDQLRPLSEPLTGAKEFQERGAEGRTPCLLLGA